MKTKKFIEVELVKSVRNCRDCKWFWDGIRPYGRFPTYDWNEDCPEAVRDQKDSSGHTPVPLLKARACGMGQVSPGIMHGCRKAPVMTIGINPNMTAYFPSMQGSSWAYPDFSSDIRYAYYYDPVRMVADALEHELQAGRLSYDKSNGHLTRAEGGCTFCRNSEWAFTEPCAYGKKADMQNEKENVDKIVKAILSVNNI